MKIGVKLTIIFFSIAFLSMLVVGFISYNQAKTSLEKEAFNRLTAVREMKTNQITNYLKMIEDQLLSFSEDPTTIRAMKKFKLGFDTIVKEFDLSSQSHSDLRKSVDGYIEKNVLPNLNKNLPNKLRAEDVSPLSDNA